MAIKLLYPWSLKEAQNLDEVDSWRESYKLNCHCARLIEMGIEQNFADDRLDTDFMKDIISEFGYDRVNYVMANTVKQHFDDGRFNIDNKQWSKGIYIPSEDVNWHFSVETHPGLVDMCVSRLRNEWASMNLYDRSHCTDDRYYQDRLLVMKPTVLADEYKSPDYQLFYATSGFGCDPTKMGTSISGYFLKDDEFCHFRRSDFYGVVDEQYLPEWAKEKLQEYQAQDESQTIEGDLKCE